jgi:CBS domain-containing protein
MESFGRARRVRIYVSEGDLAGHQPVHAAIMQFLRKEGAQGATVFRGAEGFGAAGQLHVSHLVDVAGKLPLVVEWIDRADRVDRLMPRLRELVRHGFITAEETEIVLYQPHPVRELAAAVTAGDVMSRELTSVEPGAPVRQMVEQILGHAYRAVPVVSRGRLVGIITGSDLVERGGLGVRLELLPGLARPELLRQLESLAGRSATAAEVMSPRPLTVKPSTPLPEVALLMVRRRLKRLPVVDEAGTLVGMVSRYDLLRSAAGGYQLPDSAPRELGLAADAPLSSVMRRDVPTVHPDTPLPETMQAMVSTRLNLALVVDHQRRVVGLVSDRALLERLTPALHPGVLRSLMLRLPFAHPRPEEAEAAAHARAHTAGDLMSASVPAALEGTRLSDAIALMLRDHAKILAVTGHDGALVGIVDRADLLRGLLSGPA